MKNDPERVRLNIDCREIFVKGRNKRKALGEMRRNSKKNECSPLLN